MKSLQTSHNKLWHFLNQKELFLTFQRIWTLHKPGTIAIIHQIQLPADPPRRACAKFLIMLQRNARHADRWSIAMDLTRPTSNVVSTVACEQALQFGDIVRGHARRARERRQSRVTLAARFTRHSRLNLRISKIAASGVTQFVIKNDNYEKGVKTDTEDCFIHLFIILKFCKKREKEVNTFLWCKILNICNILSRKMATKQT